MKNLVLFLSVILGFFVIFSFRAKPTYALLPLCYEGYCYTSGGTRIAPTPAPCTTGTCGTSPGSCYTQANKVCHGSCGSNCDCDGAHNSHSLSWSKFNPSCRQTSPTSCSWYWIYSTAACSTADKCVTNSGVYGPYLNYGTCSCTAGGIYKTCCNGYNLSGTACTKLDSDGHTPYEGKCPSGTSTVACNVSSCTVFINAGYKCTTGACGSSACHAVFPPPTATPTPVNLPPPPTGLTTSTFCQSTASGTNFSWNAVAGATYYLQSYNNYAAVNIPAPTTSRRVPPDSTCQTGPGGCSFGYNLNLPWYVKACNANGCSAQVNGPNFVTKDCAVVQTCTVDWSNVPANPVAGHAYTFPITFTSNFGIKYPSVYLDPGGSTIYRNTGVNNPASTTYTTNITIPSTLAVGSYAFQPFLDNATTGVHCEPSKNFDVSYPAWYQSVGGDVRKDDGISLEIPSGKYLSTSQASPSLDGGVVYTSQPSASFGSGTANSNNWLAKSLGFAPDSSGIKTSYAYVTASAQKLKNCSYDMYSTTGNSNCTTTLSQSACDTGTAAPDCDLRDNPVPGVYTFTGDLNLTSGLPFYFNSAGTYVFLIDGNLNIDRSLFAIQGVGSTVIFIVSGDIMVNGDVTYLDGIYSADGQFNVESQGSTTDDQLLIEGSVIANAGLSTSTPFVNNRDLGDTTNATTPSVQIIYRPDFVLNAPNLVKQSTYIVSEVAPQGGNAVVPSNSPTPIPSPTPISSCVSGNGSSQSSCGGQAYFACVGSPSTCSQFTYRCPTQPPAGLCYAASHILVPNSYCGNACAQGPTPALTTCTAGTGSSQTSCGGVAYYTCVGSPSFCDQYTYRCPTQPPAGLCYAASHNITANSFCNNACDQQSPVAFWYFNEGTGTVAGDSTTNDNNGTLVGGPTWQTEANCKHGKCILFDGIDNKVTAGTGASISITGAITVEAWVKITALPASNASYVVIGKDKDTGGRAYVLDIWSSGSCPSTAGETCIRFYINGGGSLTSNEMRAKTAIQLNTWYHIAGTYTPSGAMHIYVNGVLADSNSITTAPSSINAATTTLDIGAREYTGYLGYLKGYIDEPKIYNYVRTATQIVQDM